MPVRPRLSPRHIRVVGAALLAGLTCLGANFIEPTLVQTTKPDYKLLCE